jgi:uncharacterized NAD(P)/FAD-binding protein YdhS
MPMQAVDLKELLKDYYDTDLFLAVTRDRTRVVGTGKTMQDAVEKAAQHGHRDPIVMRAPRRGFPNRFHF